MTARRPEVEVVLSIAQSSKRDAHEPVVVAKSSKVISLAVPPAVIGRWQWDIQNDRVTGDSNLKRMFGLPATHAEGRPLADYLDALHPQDRARVSESIGRSIAIGGVDNYEIEYRLVVAGHELWVRARGCVERRADGVAVSLPGIVTDITQERRLLAERSKALENLLSQGHVFDATLAAIRDFVFVFDLDGKFRYANKPLLDLWGISLAAAVGKDFFDLSYPAPLAFRLLQQIEQVIRSGTTLCDETAYTSPTGVIGHYEYIFSPIFAADGSVEAVAGTARDITARKRVEEDLRRRTSQFETLLNQVPVGVYLVDADLRIQGANPLAWTLFGDPPELIGRDLAQITHQLWPTGQADELVERVRHTLLTGEVSVVSGLPGAGLDERETFRYRGMIHRILADDDRPGAVCYFRGTPG